MPWKSKVTSLRAPETPNLFTDGANLGARRNNNQGWVPCVRGDKGGSRSYSHISWFVCLFDRALHLITTVHPTFSLRVIPNPFLHGPTLYPAWGGDSRGLAASKERVF